MPEKDGKGGGGPLGGGSSKEKKEDKIEFVGIAELSKKIQGGLGNDTVAIQKGIQDEAKRGNDLAEERGELLTQIVQKLDGGLGSARMA